MKALFKTLFIGLFMLQTSYAIADLDGETITYFLTDHLGSPVVAMDEEGELLWKRDYSAFGEAQDEENGVQVGHTGHEFVPESGLSYMGARWYHPKIGRFLQPDPVGFVSSNSLSFNRYLYVNNNPFQYVDPDGRYLTPANDMANKLASAIPSTSASTGLQDITISASNSVNLGTAGSPGGFAPIMSAQEYAANSTASASTVVGGWIAADVVVPEPTDVLPHKWIGYGAAIGAAATFDWTVGKIISALSSRHSPDQQALNDIIRETTNGGRKPLSGNDADTILDWADELGVEGARDDRGKDHWEGGEHIHVPGSGINHIPTE